MDLGNEKKDTEQLRSDIEENLETDDLLTNQEEQEENRFWNKVKSEEIPQEVKQRMQEFCETLEEPDRNAQSVWPETGNALATEPLQRGKNVSRQERFSWKRLIIPVAAAIAVLGTTVGATMGRLFLQPWSNSMEAQLGLAEEVVEELEESGEASKLEYSVTDNGITVTLMECITNPGAVLMMFRIDGYDLPEGERPWFGKETVKINGVKLMQGDGSGGFVFGIDENEPAGFPNKLKYAREDGSLEYHISFDELPFIKDAEGNVRDDFADFTFAGANVEISFEDLISGTMPVLEENDENVRNGKWDLSFTLPEDVKSVKYRVDMPEEWSDCRIIGVTASSMMLQLDVQGDPERTDYYILNLYHVIAIVLKDGTEINFFQTKRALPRLFMLDEEKRIGRMQLIPNSLFLPEELDALVLIRELKSNLGNDLKEEDYVVVPLYKAE